MEELTLRQFVDAASESDLSEFIASFCGGSRNYLYQITNGHRNIGVSRAKRAAKWFEHRGYNVPLRKLRPDIWGTD